MTNFRKAAAGILLFLFFPVMAACAGPEPLSGTYSASYYGTGITYFFSDEIVSVRYLVGGYEIGRFEGTYSLNDDRTQITLTFDADQMTTGNSLPTGLTSLGGTFEFQQGDGYIVIGQIRYDLTENDSSADLPDDAPRSDQSSVPGPVTEPDPPENDNGPDPAALQLNLPEAYTIQYSIHDEYGWSRDYTQTMTKCSDGFYFDFGDTGERYIFMRLDSGMYLQYRYDASTGNIPRPS